MKTFQLSIGNAAALALNSTNPIFQIATPSGLGLVILAIELDQINDETAQQLGVRLTRRSTASTLPNSVAAENMDRRNSATSGLTFSTTTNAYGVATVTGTRVAEVRLPSFDARAGLYWEPAPERRIHIPPSAFYTLDFEAAPGATPTWVPKVYVAEE
jgi:hypothetical protein